MTHPSTICQPTQTELRRILARTIRDYVANWFDTNPPRRVSLEDAILQGIDSSMDEDEEYDGQRVAENRHSYRFAMTDAPEPYQPSEQDRHEDALTAEKDKWVTTEEQEKILTQVFGLLAFASGYVQNPERKEEFRKAAFDLATLIPGATKK